MFRRVLVTGSRNWKSSAHVWEVLDKELDSCSGMVLVHGACPKGADICHAFITPESKGTRQCVKAAEAAGIEVVYHFEE